MVTRDSRPVSSSSRPESPKVWLTCCCANFSSSALASFFCDLFFAFAFLVSAGLESVGLLLGHGAFGYRNDAEVSAAANALEYGLGNPLGIVGELGEQDDVCAAGKTCAQGQPAGLGAP